VSELLALVSALVYGTADYIGGHASRRLNSAVVTLFGQIAGIAMLGACVLVLRDPVAPMRDWWWGLGAGGIGAIALVSFYRALADGVIAIVAPITAVTSAIVPAIVGFASGDRLSTTAWIGVSTAVVAIALVSGAGVGGAGTTLGGARRMPRHALALSFVAGLGFGFIYVMLAHTGHDAGLWPVLAMRVVSIPLVALMAARHLGATRTRLPARVWGLVLLGGALDSGANAIYLLSTRHGALAVVGVIAALYPVSTVALAFARDGERVAPAQVVGMLVAAASLVLVSLG
jgi:drug/metabolite transporter (DMT)-like permease